MEGHERMDAGQVSGGAKKTESGAEAPKSDAERAQSDLGRRAESLGERVASFESHDMAEAEKMLSRIKDPAKRDEFAAALSKFRGRTSGVGNAVRGAVAGLALLAGGVGIGKGMNDERQQAAMMEMAKKTGEAEAENRMLREQLAKGERAVASKDAGGDRAMDALAGENTELRKQLTAMAKELAQLRKERDEANQKVLAEKEKGIVTQDALMKQQAVSGNLQSLYEKMRSLIDQSGDQKLKDDADRFLEAYM
jgi:hypothetical protein